MSEKNNKFLNSAIIVKKEDLPLACPIKQTWDGHPKIYLDIKEKKQIICPYCGNKYKLQAD